MWRSLVARLNGVQEAASSNLVTPTSSEAKVSLLLFFCIFTNYKKSYALHLASSLPIKSTFLYHFLSVARFARNLYLLDFREHKKHRVTLGAFLCHDYAFAFSYLRAVDIEIVGTQSKNLACWYKSLLSAFAVCNNSDMRKKYLSKTLYFAHYSVTRTARSLWRRFRGLQKYCH